ncbi:hypothetical protein GCM10022262_34060 [Georgenia daeguensis]|uniref:HAD-IA family hydrolase n=1 Tax=Georgenia daeguensis TaxID=908355 RepID=A0ABP8EYK1_9MICO
MWPFVSADDVECPKSAPDMLLRAAAVLEVSPSRCLVVKESDLGVAAARNAGMSVLKFLRT